MFVCLSHVKQTKFANGVNAGLASSESNAMKGHAPTKLGNRPSNTAVSSWPRPHTFYRQVQLKSLFSILLSRITNKKSSEEEQLILFPLFQPSFTFSYYGRVGSQRYRLRRSAPSSPRPIVTCRSLNDLSDLRRNTDKRKLELSASSLSSEGSSSDGEPGRGITVRLLWLSMLKVRQFGNSIHGDVLLCWFCYCSATY